MHPLSGWLTRPSGLLTPRPGFFVPTISGGGSGDLGNGDSSGGGVVPKVFESDWGTATGQTENALTDGGVWDDDTGISGKNSSIVTASSLSLTKWPATNVFRVSAYGSSITAQTIQIDLGTPTNGLDRYFRVYVQVPWANSHGASDHANAEHGIEGAPELIGGGHGFNPYMVPQNDGTWWPGYREIRTSDRFHAFDFGLLKTETYRYEWHIAYGTSTYTVEVRIYDEDGVLTVESSDFSEHLPSEDAGSLIGDWTFSYTASDHRYFRVGTNGPGSNFPLTNISDDDPLFYFGAVAVSETNWCGAY